MKKPFPLLLTLRDHAGYTTVKGAAFAPGLPYRAEANTSSTVFELIHPATEERACFAASEVRPLTNAELAKKAPLTPTQLDGCACVVCGESRRPMVPVPEVETRSSTHLFACDRPACATTPAEVLARIPAAQRVA